MDRFLTIEAFVRVAETGNFAEASRHLGVAASVVSARVQALERAIGAPLFHRSTRHVRLSETGEAHYRECAEMVVALGSLTDRMRGARTTPSGRLRMQMLPGFGLDHFGPILQAFGNSCPDIRIEIVMNDRVVDPIEDGLDLTFQIFPPLSESLVARRLFEVRRLFCASPAYLESHGMPTDPGELRQHRIGVYSGYPTRNRWAFCGDGREAVVELPGEVRSNSVHLLRDFARSGGGIVCLPTLVASRELLHGDLVPVLERYRLSSFPFSAVFPRTQRDTMKVRLLVDFLAARFKGLEDLPPWDVPLLERGWLQLKG